MALDLPTRQASVAGRIIGTAQARRGMPGRYAGGLMQLPSESMTGAVRFHAQPFDTGGVHPAVSDWAALAAFGVNPRFAYEEAASLLR